jgi:predicted metal-dependent phosphoesterase TrpH
MKLDLHVHSTASDGACDPREVVSRASRSGLDVISITDHDTTAGLGSALEAAANLRLHIIPGIEMSSTHEDREYHILGYFVDPDAPALKAHERTALDGRERRMIEMVERLRGQGLLITYDEVLEAAGPERSSIARPHLARVLVEHGYASSTPDAFNRLIGDSHPAHVPTRLATPAEAIQIILDSGGIPVWAHPPNAARHRLLPEFVREGLLGVEVYRPRSRPDHIVGLEQAAKAHDLIVTGGSDWHTPDAGSELGAFHVTEEEVAGLLEAGGM